MYLTVFSSLKLEDILFALLSKEGDTLIVLSTNYEDCRNIRYSMWKIVYDLKVLHFSQLDRKLSQCMCIT